MAYLKQFARNQKTRGNTIVLTARLPEGTYDAFKLYCDDLGLSISEAVNLLVENELRGIQAESEVAVSVSTDDDIKNDDEYKVNTKASKPKRSASTSNTKRFITTQFQINNELPCPLCASWVNHKNFARHAKKHNTNTQGIFTDDQYKDKIQAMIEVRQGE